ncbi:hypothetical protein QCA50_013553 [Cerrena zonata]|uniref:Uncharacterized protein n=1 Tax=Cerrena zonata TaxID=2478898 RepID=A0AAW0FR03_9APHY
MTTRTQFQVTRHALMQLTQGLTAIQLYACQPHSTLHYDPAIRVCSDTLRSIITTFRSTVARHAHETADFLLSNIFSNLLQDTISNEAKTLIIDRFFYAPDSDRPSLVGTKMRGVGNLRQRVEQLQATLNGSQVALQGQNIDTAMIHGNFEIVIGGIRTIHGFYEQICQTLETFRGQLDHGYVSIEDIQSEARWLAVISADLKAFASPDTPGW